ncbi:MAG: nodulation protein NfeD [Pseudomonadota bacterium]
MVNQPTARAGSMARLSFWAVVFALGAALFALSATAQETEPAAPSRAATVLTLNGPVTPASADYLAREIGNADAGDHELIVIEIDTPGGLVDSMKTIIKAILSSETPVASFVSPQGARSASAGLYIMYASHVSAMTPFTNTGAATPVELGGTPSGDNPFEGESPFDEAADERAEGETVSDDGAEESLESAPRGASDELGGEMVETGDRPLGNEDAMRAKIINDSVAYIRALAEERGRNADWAERAVREGVSVTHNEALELGVIDLVAADLDELLTAIDGRTVETIAGPKTLQTSSLSITRVEPTFIEQILNFIANPNVAVILMSLATTGIIIEMWNPGSVFPGALGALCLILGLYSFQVLPFSWLGAALMGVGLILMTVEAFTPTFGIAGVFGLLVFGAGLYTVFPDQFRVSTGLIGVMMASVGGLLGLMLIAVVGSRSHGPLIGSEAIRKREGYVDDWDGKEGWVVVEGERWRARADKPLNPGDKIKVVEVDGLVLVVRQAKGVNLLASLAPSET